MKGNPLLQGEIIVKDKKKYTYFYFRNHLLQNQQAHFNESWYKSSLDRYSNIRIVQIKSQVLFKGEIFTKMQK
jgi:hypothetical protein